MLKVNGIKAWNYFFGFLFPWHPNLKKIIEELYLEKNYNSNSNNNNDDNNYNNKDNNNNNNNKEKKKKKK